MSKTIAVLLLLTGLSFLALFHFPLQLEQDHIPKAPKPRFGGIYKRAIPGPPSTLDPAYVTDTTSSEVVTQIFSRLLKMNDKLEIQPDLVHEWTISPDKKSYTFYLKSKVRFHTITEDTKLSSNKGRELQSNDVEFTLHRLLSPGTKSPHATSLFCIDGAQEFYENKADRISGFSILGPYSFQIRLKYPFAAFLSILTTPPLSIVPKEDVIKWGKDFSIHPVGSGAFIFEKYIPNEMIVLRSNLDFHKGRPYLDKLHFLILPLDNQQFEAFEKRQIFHVERLQSFQLREALKKGDYKFQEISALETTYLGMNITLPPFDNIHVRKALNYAINKAMLVKYVRKGRGLVSKGPLPRGIREYNPVLKSYDFDLEQARIELEQAGYKFNSKGLVVDFPPITLQASKSIGTVNVSEAIQANLADLGIRLSLKFVSISEHYNTIDTGKIPFFFLGWLADYPDADNILYYNFHSRNIGTNNSSWYSNATVDRLLEMARSTENEEERKHVYQQAEQLIVNDAPWIFLYYPTTYILFHPFVHGVKLSPFGISEINYYNVWLEEETAKE
jgi:peptide/nickel transport system substrate-binding protein/oligopeptide transport system substrate-binding protein